MPRPAPRSRRGLLGALLVLLALLTIVDSAPSRMMRQGVPTGVAATLLDV